MIFQSKNFSTVRLSSSKATILLQSRLKCHLSAGTVLEHWSQPTTWSPSSWRRQIMNSLSLSTSVVVRNNFMISSGWPDPTTALHVRTYDPAKRRTSARIQRILDGGTQTSEASNSLSFRMISFIRNTSSLVGYMLFSCTRICTDEMPSWISLTSILTSALTAARNCGGSDGSGGLTGGDERRGGDGPSNSSVALKIKSHSLFCWSDHVLLTPLDVYTDSWLGVLPMQFSTTLFSQFAVVVPLAALLVG